MITIVNFLLGFFFFKKRSVCQLLRPSFWLDLFRDTSEQGNYKPPFWSSSTDFPFALKNWVFLLRSEFPWTNHIWICLDQMHDKMNVMHEHLIAPNDAGLLIIWSDTSGGNFSTIPNPSFCSFCWTFAVQWSLFKKLIMPLFLLSILFSYATTSTTSHLSASTCTFGTSYSSIASIYLRSRSRLWLWPRPWSWLWKYNQSFPNGSTCSSSSSCHSTSWFDLASCSIQNIPPVPVSIL